MKTRGVRAGKIVVVADAVVRDLGFFKDSGIVYVFIVAGRALDKNERQSGSAGAGHEIAILSARTWPLFKEELTENLKTQDVWPKN